VYTAFPCSDSYAPSDSPLWHCAFARRFPLATSPLRFTSQKRLPCSPCRTHTRWLRWHVTRRPIHALWLPSTGRGYAGVSLPPSAESLLWSASVSTPPKRFELDWRAYEVRDARGSVPRRTMRASGDSPSHLSAKRHLLDPSLPLMASFRCMLLTP
jgi:hypothetical protein